jgi:hypothetical protein
MSKSAILILGIVLIVLGILVNFIPIVYYYFVEYPKFSFDGITRGAIFSYSGHLTIFIVRNNNSRTLISSNLILMNVTDIGNGNYSILISGSYNISIINIKENNVIKRYCIIDYHTVLPSTSPLIKALFITNPNSLIATIGNCSISLCIPSHTFTGQTWLDPYIARPPNICTGPLSYLVLADNQKVLGIVGFEFHYPTNQTSYIVHYPTNTSNNFISLHHEFINIMLNLFNYTSLHNYLNFTNSKSYSVSIALYLYYTNVRPSNNIIGDLLWNLGTTFFPINFALIIMGIIIIIIHVRRKHR